MRGCASANRESADFAQNNPGPRHDVIPPVLGMLAKLLLGIALVALATAQNPVTSEDEQCASREELQDVKEKLAKVSSAVDAWQYILKSMLGQGAGGDENGQCPCDFDLIKEALKHARNNITEEVRNAFYVTEAQFYDIQEKLYQLEGQIAVNGSQKGSYPNPAISCHQVARLSPNALPGYVWLQKPDSDPTFVYCAATTQCCSSPGGWMRVAYLDMTDPHQTCPQGFKQINSPKRSCGRKLTSGGCNSVTFSMHGFNYSKICGQVIGYHVGSPSGFHTPHTSIDDAYIEGVSITHGQNPRKHIWSFANALQETTGFYGDTHICPCTNPASRMPIPSFVGNDYFCDAGSKTTGRIGVFYPDDPLWDGHGCEVASTCCEFNNPPFFCKELSQPTTDDIEVRLCADENPHNEDSPIELIELYVQ